MPSPEMLARMPLPPTLLAQIPPELLAQMTSLSGEAVPVLGGPFSVNGVATNGSPLYVDPKKSAEYEKRQVAIRLLQTGKLNRVRLFFAIYEKDQNLSKCGGVKLSLLVLGELC